MLFLEAAGMVIGWIWGTRRVMAVGIGDVGTTKKVTTVGIVVIRTTIHCLAVHQHWHSPTGWLP